MGRGAKLPALSKQDGQASVALALARVRSSTAWTADASVDELCAYKPPFGLRDSAGRINGVLWTALHNSSAPLPHNGSSGRRLAVENQTLVTIACMQLARVLIRSTGRPSPKEHGTCAVVGSSGGLTGSRQGAQIDAHDAVYRFNTAPVGGPYIADVGNRTSVWVASHIPWRSQAKRAAALSRQGSSSEAAALYCFNPWLGSCHVDALGSRKFHGLTSPLLLNPQLAAGMMQMQVALGGKSGGNVRPSAGLMGVGLALASCARVSLFGFGNDTDPRMQGHCNHYYDCRTNQTNYFAGRMGYHDWHSQWKVLDTLISLGAVRYHAPTGEPNTFHRRPPPEKPAGQKFPAPGLRLETCSWLIHSIARQGWNR